MYADTVELVEQCKLRMAWYMHQHQEPMSLPAIAQMVSIMLYHKRFFPYYVFTVLGGINPDGEGTVYSFDPVGSYESHQCRAGGSAASLIQPFLDNQVSKKNLAGVKYTPPTKDQALKLVRDAFTSATERDIHTGDYLEVFCVDKDGVKVDKFDLKKD
jgi:20S proteasome subunit beta 6